MADLPELEHRRLRASAEERFGSALSDGMFMTSRDGQTFDLWPESFIRPLVFAGDPVRLRFLLRDADLYSFQFQAGA